MTCFFISRFYKYLLPMLMTGCFLFANENSFTGLNPPASPSHIVFIEDSWTEALKQAKSQHKYIFVDAYASW